MSEQAKIRRIQHTLSIAGSGVFAFCVWSLAKISLFLSLVDESTLQTTLCNLLGIDSDTLMNGVYATIVAIIIIDLVVRIYVGMSARAEGRGKKKGSFYLVVAAIAALANISSLVFIAFSTSLTLFPLDMVISIAVEATAVAALVLVIYSSIALRRMSRMEG